MGTARWRILFVEDNEIDQMAIERFVGKEASPYDYVIASSVDEARTVLESEHFDVAVLDYLIGAQTAFDLFDNVNATPIIIVTGIGDEGIAVKAMKAGAYDYLRKDPQGHYLNILPVTVENVIRRKQSEDELKRYREYLEKVVEIRTVELQKEIERRKQAEESLIVEHESLAQKVKTRTAELQKANSELARAVRLKDEFLANMSHELRTPLHIMLGLSEALQEQVYGELNQKQLSTIGTIEEKGHQLLELITGLLDLSRIVTRNLELDLIPVSVGAVGRTSIDSIHPLAQKKHIRTSYTCASTVTTIQADERRLKQILINLLNNAVKFTPEGGAIGLNVEENSNQQCVCFKVWDTGIGIKKEDIEQLFTQPLIQLDGKLSRRYPGIGLGLSLTYHIVKMHGGTIRIESEIGKGSCFTVVFPQKYPA